jgi:GNAT superfamily N-acetyltransferase
MEYTIKEERLSAEEYIDFLKHTDLGSQYPKERFRERIGTLVTRASISLVARNTRNEIVGVCFGITDFAYWLFITDLGVVREYTGCGVGTALVKELHRLAGGEDKTLAADLECWYQEYKTLWHTTSRESELYRIGEVIFWMADFLRK